MSENKKRLLQRTKPIKILDIKRAENHEQHSTKPMGTLNKHTLPISTFLRESEYQEIFSIGQKMYPILNELNKERNTLHFLNIEYIASKLSLDDWVQIKNCVVVHIDGLIEKIEKYDNAHLEFGKMQVESFS